MVALTIAAQSLCLISRMTDICMAVCQFGGKTKAHERRYQQSCSLFCRSYACPKQRVTKMELQQATKATCFNFSLKIGVLTVCLWCVTNASFFFFLMSSFFFNWYLFPWDFYSLSVVADGDGGCWWLLKLDINSHGFPNIVL